MTHSLTLHPPNASLFAAVQLDVPDQAEETGHRVVGAAPAFRVEVDRDDHGNVIRRRMIPLERVEVVLCNLRDGDHEVRAVWAYEDSTVPNEETPARLHGEHGHVVGGLRVTR